MNTVNEMTHHVGSAVNGYVLESVLGYNFGYDKQLASLWLAVYYRPYTVLTSPKKDETAVYG